MKAIDCRARAANARRCAASSPLADDQAAWLVMARQWTALADLAETQEAAAARRLA